MLHGCSLGFGWDRGWPYLFSFDRRNFFLGVGVFLGSFACDLKDADPFRPAVVGYDVCHLPDKKVRNKRHHVAQPQTAELLERFDDV